MALVKIRNDADDGWIEVGGRLDITQSDTAPATTFPGMLWLDTDAAGGLTVIADADNDTKVQCEESADEDIIRFDVAGTENVFMQYGNIYLSGNDQYLAGKETGAAYSEIIGVNASNQIEIAGDGDAIVSPCSSMQLTAQPSFTVGMTGNTSIAATATYYTIDFDDDSSAGYHDTGSDFNTGNHQFTAPVDGVYSFCLWIRLVTYDTAANYYNLRIVTSNKTYYSIWDAQMWKATDDTNVTLQIHISTYMDASDVCYAQVYQNTGTVQSAVSGPNYSFFSGHLLG